MPNFGPIFEPGPGRPADDGGSTAVALMAAVILLAIGGLAGAGLMWAFG